ncbi:hypothetical protein BX661DRAFT_188320 [Kickxella alabastrina]|uniref:uncharacterized protein n=1 Tax=Kickxella alabastrina TaxID=61397 RepID=UPI00221FC917|nr:uncharacterized protein BX661DRAFT_188320 [Kickxella alabastrina]KAI7821439.1 hypothetical protein BX661DRAFT_188320 [Kickxella alabastrina]
MELLSALCRKFGGTTNWRHFLLILALGQLLSLCITSTSVLSNQLAKYQNVSIPNFQSFMVYALLFIFLWYIFLAAVDVEGNYFVIKAYSYTSLLSCMLLDTWALPCVTILSFFMLRARYRWMQVVGVLLCLGGMGLLVKGDMDAGKNYKALNALKEFIVRKRPQYETVAWLGFFGTIINGVQMGIIEHKELKTLVWTKEVVRYTIGFDLVMFVLYTTAPFLFRLSSATFYNLSILTSDFYGLIFARYMFHDKITAIYAGAFVMIVGGLLVYYLFPHAEPEHLPQVIGFRTQLPGDLEITGSEGIRRNVGSGPLRSLEDADAEQSEVVGADQWVPRVMSDYDSVKSTTKVVVETESSTMTTGTAVDAAPVANVPGANTRV